ncbi:hypothetical protein M9M90_13845 [Phenylobacterium sp. LH3H17]|nr:hypothetical protein [Phenylobacterium sp. LH3H17]UTP38294.1 hypothetical protein M9M90_13845 [Phenylobacterium sp. LH3H17]
MAVKQVDLLWPLAGVCEQERARLAAHAPFRPASLTLGDDRLMDIGNLQN